MADISEKCHSPRLNSLVSATSILGDNKISSDYIMQYNIIILNLDVLVIVDGSGFISDTSTLCYATFDLIPSNIFS